MKSRPLMKIGLLFTLLSGAFHSVADENGLQALVRSQLSAQLAQTQYTLQNDVYKDVVRSGIHFNLEEGEPTYVTRVTITDINAEIALGKDSD